MNLFDISHALVREVLFLKAPDRRRLESLQGLTINVAEYCELRQVDFIQDPDRSTTITALEFLPIFNLIENGTKFQNLWNAEHQKSGKVCLEQHQDSWILTNDSLTPLPDDCFVMGKKGENGNTGTGLALAKLFAHLQRNEVEGSSIKTDERHHQVTFKIAPQMGVTF